MRLDLIACLIILPAQPLVLAPPQQNGRVEQKHQHILNVSRALMFQGDLPISFWDERVLGSLYLINRTPFQNKLPMKLSLVLLLTLMYELKVFGTLCFVHN